MINKSKSQNPNSQIVATTLIIRISNLFSPLAADSTRLPKGNGGQEFGRRLDSSRFRYLNILIFAFCPKGMPSALFAICLLLILLSCRERVVPPDDKPPYIPPIVLTVEDIGVTDAFIRLKFLDTSNVQAKIFLLTRDGKPLITNTLFTNDTLLLDEGLLPKRTYKYIAYKLLNNIAVDSSAELPITTMDTTSHDFSWDITYLGDGASSVLRDVAIINDTCVWAVGEIYKKDSPGNWDNEPYGAARWDGKKWHLMKVSYRDFGSTTIWPGKLKAIYGFSPDNIYVASSANLLKWNGTSWQEKAFFMTDISWNGRVNKIWGTSENNLYLVGDNGAIYFYNGSPSADGWRRLESGTNQTINDVWGVHDIKTNEQFILAGASNVYNPGYIKLLQIKASGFVDTIPWISQDRRISSVWFQNQNRLFTAGGGVFRRSPVGIWKEFKEVPLIYTSRIRGQAINDIFIAGHFGLVAHFNGVNWRVYPDVAAASYYSCDYKMNNFVAVGTRNSRAVILRMWRR